jgi:ubiquinone/menaquinone biosynthesis C-methylase UbiE
MTLVEEYRNQNTWRNWESYIECLPIGRNETILDLGCSYGFVTKLLAQRASRVIGIDLNSELLNEARKENGAINIQYIDANLKNLEDVPLPLADGIWSSYSVAYFPDFAPVLDHWLQLLKPNGWIAIVEMSDLFGHFPLSNWTRSKFKEYYERQRRNNIYDFEMGSRIKDYLVNSGLEIIFEENRSDLELAFNGPADKQILIAWENRLDRMRSLQDFFGDELFQKVKIEFLECLASQEHTCNTEVKFIIARK